MKMMGDKMSSEPKWFYERVSEVQRAFKNVALFPGSKAEYEEFVGYPVQIIDTKLREKYVRDDFIHTEEQIIAKEKLLNEGLEALVNLKLVGLGGGGHAGLTLVTYGLPVRKVR